jgi:hypothetical protein
LPPEIEKKLANRISGCLLAQSDRKLSPMFCEAVIALPIAECLNESIEDELRVEPEYHWGVRQKCADLNGIYFDMAGCLGADVSFIIETKYLRKKIEVVRSQILIDLFRLSLPISAGLQRYFIVAGPKSLFPDGGGEDGFKKAIFREPGVGVTINLDEKFSDFRTQNKCK